MSDRLLPVHRLIAAINGSPQYQETVAATNATTSRNVTAFGGGEILMLQGDADFYVIAGQSTSTVSASGANAVKVTAGDKYYLCLGNGVGNTSIPETHVCLRGDTGTSNVKIFRMR